MPDRQIQIPLNGGPNETVDPRQLAPGSVIAVRNAVYDADGSYQPRLGYTALPAGPAGVRALYTHRSELLARDGANLWTYDSQGGAWATRDAIPDVLATHGPLINATTAFQSWASATYQNYRVVTWVDTLDSLVRVAVYDLNLGACVLGPTVLSPGTVATYSNVSVGIVGTTAMVVALQTSGTLSIWGWTVALAPVGAPSARTQLNTVTVETGFPPAPVACAYTATRLLVVYEHQPTGTSSVVQVNSYDSSLTSHGAGSTALGTGTYDFVALATTENAGILWVAVGVANTALSTQALVVTFDSGTLGSLVGPVTLTFPANLSHSPNFTLIKTCAIEATSATTALACFDCQNYPAECVTWQQVNSVGALTVASGATNCGLASQPHFDVAAGECVILLRTPAAIAIAFGRQMVAGAIQGVQTPYTLAGSYVLCGLPTSSVAAQSVDYWQTLAPQIVQTVAGLSICPPRFSLTAAGYEVVNPITRLGGRLGLDVFSVSRAATSQRVGATVGKEFYLGGQFYDGNRLSELGFVNAPKPFTASDQSGAPTNTYQYVATFARIDGSGNIEESAPSVTAIEVSSVPPNVNVGITPMHLTRKQREPADTNNPGGASKIVILLYRTQALENGDNTLHLVTVTPYTAGNLNSLTTDQIIINDTMPDATLATQPVLYTVSGELQHDAPESLHGVISHLNRPWGIGADQKTVWFGQEYSDGIVPAWSLFSQFTIDDANEPLTALASLYDKLFIFTRRKAYVVYGNGPSIAGTGAEWTLPPQRVPSASGCIDPRSIVNTPNGLMYQSERGIELMGLGVTVEFIGLPVSLTTAAFPVCASAALDDASSTVRFCMTTSDVPGSQAGGVLLLYDLRRNRWSMHYLTNSGAGGVAGAPCYASTVHPTLGYVEGHNLDQYGSPNTATIARQNTLADPTPWLDYGTTFVPLSVELAWIKSSDLQGWQRVRRIRALADFHDAHGLLMTVDYDYQVIGETHSRTSNQIAGFVSGSYEQVRFAPARGKSEAIRLTLATTAPTAPQVLGSGHSGGLVGVAFEIHDAKGGYRNFGIAQKG